MIFLTFPGLKNKILKMPGSPWMGELEEEVLNLEVTHVWSEAQIYCIVFIAIFILFLYFFAQVSSCQLDLYIKNTTFWA